MPKTIERTCNLTLTRNQWAVLVSLLDHVAGDASMKVRMAIRAALTADLASASVSIERDCEKWISVIQLVNKQPMSFKGEYNRVIHAMTTQVSAAEFRNP